MKLMSLRSGTFSKVVSSSVSKEAAKSGRAEFLEPLTFTSPRRGTPPQIRKISICKNENLSTNQIS